MSCCVSGTQFVADTGAAPPSDDEIRLASRDLGDGTRQIELSVPFVHCGACIRSIESTLSRLERIVDARVNLSTKRVTVRWSDGPTPPLVETLRRLGYPTHVVDESASGKDGTLGELIRAVAISGFAAANIMLLSVSVWSGAEGATRDLFHWVSALIALPALIFAGRIYYRSAWSALRHGRMNMDVPIAVGVSLAYLMSLFETITHGHHAYFDAAVSLLFFLLIGRTLDHVMRDKARGAVLGLARLAPRGAVVIAPDGSRIFRPLGEIKPGMHILVAAGERIPVDARVLSGASDLDYAMVTGESRPQPTGPGADIRAGSLNITGPLTIEATTGASDSFLAEMLRMMEAAEGGRARYRRIAERVSAVYAPVVHLTALLTFLGWLFAEGDWHHAMTIAIAVLIITCPCALGLAVPIVHVVAARRLFEQGIMVKDGSAMERLADADSVLFDKTGTLTLGKPRLVNARAIPAEARLIAAELAAHSRHPLSQSIAAYRSAIGPAPAFTGIKEYPGFGVEGFGDGHTWRLGRSDWAADTSKPIAGDTILSRDGAQVANFAFEDAVRPDARAAISELKRNLGPVEILSGDTLEACQTIAETLGIDRVSARLLPAGKVERIQELQSEGRKVLMVGDGLNDAPALSAAHVSIAPATAADIGRNAADLVFFRDSLLAVPLAAKVSRQARRLIYQNLALAIIYNATAVPVAILGYVTPLVAAVAMSSSSLLVIGNALRLARVRSAAPAGSPERYADGSIAAASSA
ncbi:cation-translocating P-type ATPase [soil metagenome]